MRDFFRGLMSIPANPTALADSPSPGGLRLRTLPTEAAALVDAPGPREAGSGGF